MSQEIHFIDMAVVNGTGYYSHSDFNALFAMNMETYKTSYVGCFPEEKLDQEYIHRKVIVYEQSLFFIPFNGKGISEYNIVTNEFSFYQLNVLKDINSYSNAFVYNHSIVMIPSYEKYEFLIFDCNLKTIKTMRSVNEKILQLCPDGFSIDLAGSCLNEEKLVFVIWDSNLIGQWDLNTNAVSITPINNCDKFACISNIDNSYFITKTSGAAVLRLSCDFINGQVYELCEIANAERCIFCIKELATTVLSIPIVPGMEYLYYKDEDDFKKIDIEYPVDFVREGVSGILFTEIIEYHGKLIWLPKKSRYVMEMDLNSSLNTVFKQIICDRDDMVYQENVRKILCDELDSNGFVLENRDKYHNIESFILIV